MYIFEVSDILFLIKYLKNPTNNFNVNNYLFLYQQHQDIWYQITT